MHCTIKKNNWHCFCCQICWIKLLTTKFQIFFIIICSNFLLISINTLKSKIVWFARKWHWLTFQLSSSRTETDLMRINCMRSIQSLKRSKRIRIREIKIISFFLTTLKTRGKFSFRTSSWSNYDRRMLLFLRWFLQTLQSRFWKVILLLISSSKFFWTRRMKAFVRSKKISIVSNLLKSSNWFFETRSLCNENEISWSSVVSFLIFAMLTRLFFSKKKLYAFAKISDNVFLLFLENLEISSSICVCKNFSFEIL